MKALLLAGGSGTRLRPITHTSAKQLVPVANKPVLFYGLEAIAAAGIRELGLVVGDTHAEIEAAVGDGSAFGLRVTYLRQEAPLGLAHAVLIAREFLGDEDFVMYLGDNFIVGGINEVVERFVRERPAAQIMLTKVAEPQAFGVAELDAGGRVVGLEEKPARPKSDLALVRLVLESVEPRVLGRVDGASELIGRVAVEAGAVVERSRVVGPAIVGAGARVRDSYVGPYTSIGASCVITGSEIEYSIVLPRASIAGVGRIESSLIGRDVEVTPAPQTPKAHRLLLGDHSKVQIGS